MTVKLLLEKGAELESRDRGSRTPLWIAAKGGHEMIAKLLLEKGRSSNSRRVGRYYQYQGTRVWQNFCNRMYPYFGKKYLLSHKP
jgi:ankyrin repeat protein